MFLSLIESSRSTQPQFNTESNVQHLPLHLLLWGCLHSHNSTSYSKGTKCWICWCLAFSRGLFQIHRQYLELILWQDKAQQATSVGRKVHRRNTLDLTPERKEGCIPHRSIWPPGVEEEFKLSLCHLALALRISALSSALLRQSKSWLVSERPVPAGNDLILLSTQSA